ncbi:uncharacterized protein LOC144147076 isoform X2 [Haemaphysalis longicornis]
MGRSLPISNRLRRPGRTTSLSDGGLRGDGWEHVTSVHAPSTFASTAPQGYVRDPLGYLRRQRPPQGPSPGNHFGTRGATAVHTTAPTMPAPPRDHYGYPRAEATSRLEQPWFVFLGLTFCFWFLFSWHF